MWLYDFKSFRALALKALSTSCTSLALVQPEADMETHQQMVADKLTVGQLMTTSLLALPPLVPVQHLVATLRASTHHSFPVTTEVETAMRSQDDFELQVPIFRALGLKHASSRNHWVVCAVHKQITRNYHALPLDTWVCEDWKARLKAHECMLGTSTAKMFELTFRNL